MKRRILSILLCLCMALSLLPTVALADDDLPGEEPAQIITSEGEDKSAEDDGISLLAVTDTFNATSDTPTISTSADLTAFAAAVNSGNSFSGKTVKLAADITLSGAWTPIGTATRSGKTASGATFSGIFDGQNHTISGLTISTGADSAAIGLFGAVSGGTVKDLKLTDVSISVAANENTGAVCGLLLDGGTVKNCEVSGSVSANNCAGIVGRLMVSGTISNCVNHAAITATGSGSNAGGIVCKAYYTKSEKEMSIVGCANDGAISASYDVGGIAALSAANITDCQNRGDVTGGIVAGGIAGEQKSYGTVSGNTNSAAITGESTGGIIGWIRYLTSENSSYANRQIITVTGNSNSGSIVGSGSLGSGGIVGNIYNAATVTGNENTASSIAGGTFAAGVVGNLQKNDGNEYSSGPLKVTGNVSTTELANITVSSGTCKDLYAYKNDTSFIVENNGAALVAQVDSTKYVTLAAAVEAADAGDTITLLNSTSVSEPILIDKNLTLDGAGYTIETTATRGIRVTTDGVELTLKNLTLDGKKKCERGVQVDYIENGGLTATVVIENCEIINMTYYAINLCSNTIVTLTITDSEVSGWSALNLYGDGYEISVTDSILTGINDKSYNAAGWNGFGVVVVEGDTTGQTTAHATNNIVTLTNCTITATETTGNSQVPILLNYQSHANKVIVQGANTKISGPEGSLLVTDNGDENVISITGGYFTADPTAYVASGYKASSGTWTVNGSSYAYQVAKLPANKIVSVNAAVLTSADGSTSEGASASISGSVISVSGQISQENKVVVTYTSTDGKSGTVTVVYSNGAFVRPSDVTVGSTTYSVSLTGLSVLPQVVKVAPAAATTAEPIADNTTMSDNEKQTATAAVTAINQTPPTATGITSAATESTITTNASGETIVKVGTSESTTVAKTATEILTETVAANATILGNNVADTKIIVQPIIDVQVTSVKEETNGTKTLTLDINAMSQVLVTKADTDVDAITVGTNAVAVGEPVKVPVNDVVVITIALPDGFATGDSLFVDHTHNNVREIVQAVVNAQAKTATFTLSGLSEAKLILSSKTCTIQYSDAYSKSYTYGDVNSELYVPDSIPSGKQFTGWTITGLTGTYTTFTEEMLAALAGKTVTATAQYASIYTGSGSSSSTYTLSFETNGGTKISSVTKAKGTSVTLSDYTTTREGYSFDGWYTDSKLTERVRSVTLSGNTTVYAKWTENTYTMDFTDVSTSDWFYDDVAYVYEEGLMQGTGSATFSPYLSTTRGMIVTILHRMEGEPAVSGACPFDDVKSGSYYEDAITWAATNSIVSGYGNGKFGPDDSITREQLAAILYNYAKLKGYDVSVGENANILSYNDAKQISEYAISAMQWACGTGLIQGSAGNLMPKDGATRAQVAAILHRFMDEYQK